MTKSRPILARHLDTEPAHGVERNVHIGFGDQLALHFDLGAGAGERQGDQQGRQKLAGNVAANADLAARAQYCRVNRERRITALPRYSMSAPRLRNASTRSPIGRSCMRGTPDNR